MLLGLRDAGHALSLGAAGRMRDPRAGVNFLRPAPIFPGMLTAASVGGQWNPKVQVGDFHSQFVET